MVIERQNRTHKTHLSLSPTGIPEEVGVAGFKVRNIKSKRKNKEFQRIPHHIYGCNYTKKEWCCRSPNKIRVTTKFFRLVEVNSCSNPNKLQNRRKNL